MDNYQENFGGLVAVVGYFSGEVKGKPAGTFERREYQAKDFDGLVDQLNADGLVMFVKLERIINSDGSIEIPEVPSKNNKYGNFFKNLFFGGSK